MNLDPTGEQDVALARGNAGTVRLPAGQAMRPKQARRRAAPADVQNAELEGRQKLWRWLILAAIGVLIVETWLAGRLRRTRSTRVEAPTT